MSAPYLLIGSFPELMRWFPKPGAWMETFKQLMGFVLLFTMVYLFFTLGDSQLFIPVLALVVGVWFACWLIGRVPYTADLDARLRAWLVGIAVAGLVGFFGFRYLGPHRSYIDWQAFSTAELAAAQQEGRTVLVDFTANWCLTCQVNKVVAIDTQRVARLIKQNDVVPLLADWSDRQSPVGQQTKQMLDVLKQRSIPLLAIFPAGSPPPPPILLPDVLTEQQVLQALQQAGPSQSVASKRSARLDR
jgi:thiol:disulfide interchange protein